MLRESVQLVLRSTLYVTRFDFPFSPVMPNLIFSAVGNKGKTIKHVPLRVRTLLGIDLIALVSVSELSHPCLYSSGSPDLRVGHDRRRQVEGKCLHPSRTSGRSNPGG